MKNLIKFSFVLFITIFLLTCDRKTSFNKLDCYTDINIHKSCGHFCKHHSYCNVFFAIHNNFPKQHIVISALGYVNQSDLDYAIKVIKDFYGYDCSIGGIEPITNDMYLNGNLSKIDADFTIEKLNQIEKTNTTIYLVNKDMYTDNMGLRGYAIRNGNTILVVADKSFMQGTLIHEIGHSLGLAHCDDLTCVMAIDNDEYDKGTFCNKCFSRLGINPTNVVTAEKTIINYPSKNESSYFGPDFYEY
jgi:predicted Zn-dependent protease